MKEPAEEPTSLHAKKLSDRLNRLFEVVHPPGRGPYSNSEVAELMAERGLETVTSTYLWMLRTGRRDNPTKRHLEALASFFGVPAAYWFDDEVAEKTAEELKLLELLRDSKIKRAPASVRRLSGRKGSGPRSRGWRAKDGGAATLQLAVFHL